MVSRVDNDEVTKLNLGSLEGETWFLAEDGLYEFFMQLNKQHALKLIEAIAKAASLLRDNVN